MRITLTLLLVLTFTKVFCQNKPWQVTGNIVVNNNGIDPVPAFALGSPAFMSNMYITKGNFLYNPQINISVNDFKPWSHNHWLLYKIPTNKGWFRIGFALSFFFKREQVNFPSKTNQNTQIINSYLPFESSYYRKISDNCTIALTNWYERGVEWDAVKWSNFTNLAINITNIPIGKNLIWNFYPSVFYLSNALPTKGLYVSETSSLFIKKTKFGLISQVVLPLSTEPKSELNANIGVQYKF